MAVFEVREIHPVGKDGALLDFGPPEAAFIRLRFPKSLKREVVYANGLKLRLDCEFSGERLEVASLALEFKNGNYLSTGLLTQLGIPGVLNRIFLETCPSTKPMQDLPNPKLLGREDVAKIVTQIYWFEYACWGNPRKKVTDYMSWSNNNANTHFRKLAKVYGLPGIHSSQELSARKLTIS